MATPVSRVVVVRAPANIILTGSLINTGSVVVPTSGNTGLIASGTLVVVNNNTVSTSSSSGTLSISGNTTITPTSIWNGQILAPTPATGTGLLQLSENGVLPNLPSTTVMTGVTNTALMTIQAGSTGASLVAGGGTFVISYIVDTPTASSGSRIYIFRSTDGDNWTPNTPDSTCILDATRTCVFRTDHLSYFGYVSSQAVSLIDITAPVVTLSGAVSMTVAQNSTYTDA
jgi:hypothetical protein